MADSTSLSSSHAQSTSNETQPASSDVLPPSIDAILAQFTPHEHMVDQPMPGGTTMTSTVLDNKVYPMFATKKRFDEIRDMEVRDSDVFLISYPKTGTHWMFSVINKLLKLELPRMWLLDIDIPGWCIEALENSSPRLIVLHLESERLPTALLESKAKIVLTTRNPKDSAVSLWQHFSKVPTPSSFKGSWNDLFDWLFKEEGGRYGGQVAHLRGYLDMFAGQQQRFRVVPFEDMKHHPRETMQGLATFLGASTDPVHINDVVEKTEFSNVKAEQAAKKDIGLLIYRKGEVGDWKNHFTVAQSEHVDQLMASKQVDYEFIYS